MYVAREKIMLSRVNACPRGGGGGGEGGTSSLGPAQGEGFSDQVTLPPFQSPPSYVWSGGGGGG